MSADLQSVLVLALLAMVAVAGTSAALTRDPKQQALVLSAYSLLMGMLLLAFHAPDVAMSELAVGAAVVPLMVVLAIRGCDREAQAHRERREEESADANGGREES